MYGKFERMDVELTIAGMGCFLLAFGHATIGFRWILPSIGADGLPRTPFGPPRLTLAMLRFTWHVLSIVLVALGVLLLTLALAPDADPKTLLLRWLAVFWLAAVALAVWNSRRRLRSIVRFPVPVVMLVIAVMCWLAST
jgi:hypothetical protein